MSVETTFAAAAQKPPAERADYLNEACGADAELRRKVERLLKAHDAAGEFLEAPAGRPDGTVDYAPISEKPGSMIGPYKLKEQIGQGGFGLVFVAEQTEPVKRKVALKVIKPGMDTREVIARFEAERQALALMDHPNIARVLDAGETDSGRPYFVMELVRGIPITDYCDQNQLLPRDRLDLFVTVCQAVQHAHQKGIIHRDIKPSNVLVTSHDSKPVVKVIDFGVAKAINQQLTERSIYTNFAQMIGTPLYMSPEQAEMSGLDIDTRSDIYSLGVLLYELLTGTTPIDKKRFAKAAYDEIRRMIREDEPQKPSTRLSTSESIASVAAHRHTEPAKLSKLIRGDLDWITMKALEKDRTRRYETANGLARDIQRYLSDEPVEACPPSAAYRLRKFAKKNRAALATAAALAMLLLAGISVSTWQAVRATQSERTAIVAQVAEAERAEGEMKAKQEALASAAAEKQALEQAQKRLAQIEKGNEIITSIFTDLDFLEVKKGTEPLEDVLAQRLVKAADLLDGETVGDPLMVAGLQNRLGRSLISLGYPKEAVPLIVKSHETRKAKLAADHPDMLTSMATLAESYEYDGKPDVAVPLFEKTLQLRKALLGADHPDTLRSMGSLASSYLHAGKLDLALPLLEETLKLRKAKLGADHPETLISMSMLAIGYQEAGKFDLALSVHEEGLTLCKAKLGVDSPHSLFGMLALAGGYRAAGKLELALPLFEKTLNLMKAKLGVNHYGTLLAIHELAQVYMAAGKLELALPLFEEGLNMTKAKLGPDHPGLLVSMRSLASCYAAGGKLDLAEALQRKALAAEKAHFGADSLSYANNLATLGLNLLRQKKWTDAEPVLRECLVLREKNHPELWNTSNTKSMLGAALMGQKKYADAEPLLLQGYEGMKQRHEMIPKMAQVRLPEAIERLVQLYEAMDKKDEAAKWRKELAAKAKLGANEPRAAAAIYDIACRHALMIAKAEDRVKQADLAMDWLQQAVAAGYKNVEHMKKDTDLDPLRDRVDFKRLIAELEAKAAEKK